MNLANPVSIEISGLVGGLCAAVISDTCNEMKGVAVSAKERVCQMISRTLLGVISAVASHALAYYVGYPLVQWGGLLGFAVYALYHHDLPENDFSHTTTAKVFAMVAGAAFSFVPWQTLFP